MTTPACPRIAAPRGATAFAAALALAAALLALPTLARTAVAQSRTGTSVGQFLLIEPSARFTAMGNAGVSANALLDAAYYNPASAGEVDKRALQLSHVGWLAGIRYDYVAAAIPLGGWGTGFATVASLNSGEIDVRTVAQPLGTGERYTVSNVAIGLGYARPISDRFSAGLQVKYFQETVWHSSAGAVAFDVGTVYKIGPDGLHIGASIVNFGTSAQFSGRDLAITYDNDPSQHGDNPQLPGQRFVESYDIPVLFRVGVGYPFKPSPDWRLWLSAEAHHPNSNPESVNAGGEAVYRNLFAVRAGWQDLFVKDAEDGLSLGAGVRGRLQSFEYHLDYAWADHGRLGDVHRLSLGLLY